MGALKKPDCKDSKSTTPTPAKKVNHLTIVNDDNTIVQKAEIERIKKAITDKIKDPALARKAAMIISEMLDKK
jgi:DNA primase large subunit